MSEFVASRRELLKTGLASMATGLTMMSLPGFAFPGQADDEELVPFQNVPRSKP